MARLRTTLAVLLFLAALTGAAASYFRTTAAAVRTSNAWTAQAMSHRGLVVLSWHRFVLSGRVDATIRYPSLADSMLDQMRKYSSDTAGAGNARYVYAGLGVAKHGPAAVTNANQFYAMYLPWWLVALVMSIPLLRRVFDRRRRSIRRADQQCESCGYDIRFSPVRCPECGQVLAAEWA